MGKSWRISGSSRNCRALPCGILYPTRAALATAIKRVLAAGVSIDGMADHGVSEAIYLHDPDGNGLELYRDRLAEEWPRTTTGELAMTTMALDLANLLAENPSTL